MKNPRILKCMVANTCEGSGESTPTFSDTDENFTSSVGIPSIGLHTSLTFKKPTNDESKSNFCEQDTQCDTMTTESDEELVSEEAECQMTEEDYVYLMERTFYLVKDTLDRRHSPLRSPIVLRKKIHGIISNRPSIMEPDLLFEEGSLEKTTTIQRRRSVPTHQMGGRFSPK